MSVAVKDNSAQRLPRNVVLVLALLLVGAFVMILNETVMSVALPTLMVEFSVSATTAQWLTTAFLLTMAVVIPLTGLILQRFSTRAVFIVALSVFTLGTVMSAFAPLFSLLVAGRVAQAAGTAVMLPLLTTTVLTLVPVSKRGRTMGLMSIVIAVAPAVGPTFSGFVLNSLSWRWMFLAVLPFAVVTLILGAILVKDFSVRSSARFDILSILLSAVAFGGLIYGLSSIGESVDGGTLMSPWVPIGVGSLSLLLFVLRQLRLQRRDEALLDLRPFRQRNFTLGTLMLMVTMAAMFGTLILLPIYLQDVLGLDTLQTGLTMLPGGLAMGIIAPFIGRAFDRWGPRALVIPGSFILAIALATMYLFTADSPVWQIAATHVTFSIGMGMVMTPLLTATLGSLRTELYSHGSAIANTLQQLAGAAGTALFITVMTAVGAVATSQGAGDMESMAAGIHGAFMWGGILALGSAVLSFFIRRTDATSHDARASEAAPGIA